MTDPKDRPPRHDPPKPTTEDIRLRQQAIGLKLRQMFEDVVNEPVPETFLEVLRRRDGLEPPPEAHAAEDGPDPIEGLRSGSNSGPGPGAGA